MYGIENVHGNFVVYLQDHIKKFECIYGKTSMEIIDVSVFSIVLCVMHHK